jgi:hypothetical protein
MNNVISLCDYRQKKLDELASYTRTKRSFIDKFVRDLEMSKEMSYNVNDDWEWLENEYSIDTITFSIDVDDNGDR